MRVQFITSLAAAFFAAFFACESSQGALVTLNATADHSALIRDSASSTAQYDRPDTLWGTLGTSVSRRRNGLVEFEGLDTDTQAGLLAGTLQLNSVTLELWNTANSWTETTLLFARLADDDADWASFNGPDDGSEGVSSWSNKDQDTPVDWVSGDGAGYTTGGQIFGSLTSSFTSESGVTMDGEMKWEVSLSGSELLDWLTNPLIDPNLLVYWDSQAGNTNAVQTRFATINTADVADQFAPNLVLDITPVPEPSAALIALPVLLGLGVCARRRAVA